MKPEIATIKYGRFGDRFVAVIAVYSRDIPFVDSRQCILKSFGCIFSKRGEKEGGRKRECVEERGEGERGGGRERERERDRETDRDRDRDRERQRETERDRERLTERQRQREKDRERERQRQRET